MSFYQNPWTPYNGYSPEVPPFTDETDGQPRPVGVGNRTGFGTYNPQVAPSYYQQTAVNTAYSYYKPADMAMASMQWVTPLAGAYLGSKLGLYDMASFRGKSGVTGRAGRMAGRFAFGTAARAVGMDTENGFFGRAAVGAGETLGGFAGSMAGPFITAKAAEVALYEGVYKPYAYSRKIANQAAFQFAGVPLEGGDMGSVYTSTGMGARGAASYGNAMQKYGMSNFFFTQKDVAHFAGLMQQNGLLSNDNSLDELKKKTLEGLKTIRSVLQVASLTGGEVVKILGAFKQGGAGMAQAGRDIQKLAQYGATSGLGIQNLVNTAMQGAQMGAAMGYVPVNAGMFEARVSSSFETAYHNRMIGNAVYGLLGGPQGAANLALTGQEQYANSPYGTIEMINEMTGQSNANGFLPQQMANAGAALAANPVNVSGLEQLNEPFLKSRLLKKHPDIVAQRIADYAKMYFPMDVQSNGEVQAGAFYRAGLAMHLSPEAIREAEYAQLARQKAGNNASELAGKTQQSLRQQQTAMSQSGRDWGGLPRAVLEPFYAAGGVTSEVSRGVSTDWGDLVHWGHKELYKAQYGSSLYALHKAKQDYEGASGFSKDVMDKMTSTTALPTHFSVGDYVPRDNLGKPVYDALPSFDFEAMGVSKKLNAYLTGKPGEDRDQAARIGQELSEGHYKNAQARYLALTGETASISTLRGIKVSGVLKAPAKVAILHGLHKQSWWQESVSASLAHRYDGQLLAMARNRYLRALKNEEEAPSTQTREALEKAQKEYVKISGTPVTMTTHVKWAEIHDQLLGKGIDIRHEKDYENRMSVVHQLQDIPATKAGRLKLTQEILKNPGQFGVTSTVAKELRGMEEGKNPKQWKLALKSVEHDKIVQDLANTKFYSPEPLKATKKIVSDKGVMHNLELHGGMMVNAKHVTVVQGGSPAGNKKTTSGWSWGAALQDTLGVPSVPVKDR